MAEVWKYSWSTPRGVDEGIGRKLKGFLWMLEEWGYARWVWSRNG
ncbi:MAG: hypothetical protein N3E44_02830 [Candidatus Bathyarchaeota archaeon]|nr:hypothetical protein [Candidatus Bathyarchaeota archaeon]